MKRKGFTIIELLLVISAVAVFVGIVIPRFKQMRNEMKMSKLNVELTILQKAIESYYMNQAPNVYPASSTTICATTLNSASPLIVSKVLTDPFSTAEYNYINNGAYYILLSKGHDGVADITGISAAGFFAGIAGDDIYATNGEGFKKKKRGLQSDQGKSKSGNKI